MAAATFTITDESSNSFAGNGMSFTQTVPPGTYTIHYGDVLGFATPPPTTASLDSAGAITFNGDYVRLPPVLSVSPLAVNFDRQIIGMPSPTKNVIIQNSGGGTLVPTIDISGEFLQINNCPPGLSAGQRCQATVSFTPSEPGTRNGTVSINNLSPVLNQQIVLAGVGTLAFPLKGSMPGSDEGLTAGTAEINAVFDHSMQNNRNQYAIYGCDQKVTDFISETGDVPPTAKIGTRCEKGYSQTSGDVFAVNGKYRGAGEPKILFYDGHPGYNYQSIFGNQVYAATGGTVHYPELQDAQITVGGDPDDFHVLELDAADDLKLFYLHLSTHPRAISIHLEKSTTGRDFIGIQDSRFADTAKSHHATPMGALSFSGTVTINGVPAVKSAVKLSGITVPDKRGQSSCVDEVVETDPMVSMTSKVLQKVFIT